MNTTRILENIGLSSKEIKIYLALLTLNSASVLELSKETHLKRTTIYPFLDSLKSKGLIEWGMGKYDKKAKIKDPQQLIRYAKAQKRRYGRAVMKLEESFDEIQNQYSEDLSDVEVKYYQGIEECRIMNTELLKAKGEVLSYSSWMKYPYLGEEWCKRLYNKLSKSKRFKVERELVSGTEHNLYHAKEYVRNPNYKKNYFFKFIPPRREFIKVDIHIFNDIKMIFSFKGVKPNGILIRNKDVVESEKAIFKVLYKEVGLFYEEYLEQHKIRVDKLQHTHK